jgi:hypothetical protein
MAKIWKEWAYTFRQTMLCNSLKVLRHEIFDLGFCLLTTIYLLWNLRGKFSNILQQTVLQSKDSKSRAIFLAGRSRSRIKNVYIFTFLFVVLVDPYFVISPEH